MPTLYRTHMRVRTEQIRTVRKITKKAKEASSVVTCGITWFHQEMNRIHVRTAIRAWMMPLNVTLGAVGDGFCFLLIWFVAIGPPYGISVLHDISIWKDFQYLCPNTILLKKGIPYVAKAEKRIRYIGERRYDEILVK